MIAVKSCMPVHCCRNALVGDSALLLGVLGAWHDVVVVEWVSDNHRVT